MSSISPNQRLSRLSIKRTTTSESRKSKVTNASPDRNTNASVKPFGQQEKGSKGKSKNGKPDHFKRFLTNKEADNNDVFSGSAAGRKGSIIVGDIA